uniref:Uncharacterized protein n=1 Tax=Papio anubis TaxID=9555 RepID=A0A8I5MVX4_PAPAN
MKTREQLPPMKQQQSGYQEAEAVSPARGRISQVWDRLHFRDSIQGSTLHLVVISPSAPLGRDCFSDLTCFL